MRMTGLEPARYKAMEPKSIVYANFTTSASDMSECGDFFHTHPRTITTELYHIKIPMSRAKRQKSAPEGALFIYITY